ncbi:MAG TPA: lasso peptide biosynthesis B2 protein [Opitutaceae bacterium]
MNAAQKFLRRNASDRLLLLEALGWLCWARLLLVSVPFRWIAPRLGRHMEETSGALAEPGRPVADRVSWAVEAVARQAPRAFVCLPQAMAAKWMLRRRRIACTIYLGLRRGEEAGLTAHAWVRAGNKILTGRQEAVGHQVIASFGD